jgi:hypothetical protein
MPLGRRKMAVVFVVVRAGASTVEGGRGVLLLVLGELAVVPVVGERVGMPRVVAMR